MSKICIFPDCGRKRDSALGYCCSHKRQIDRGKELTPIALPILICSYPECGRRNYRLGLCAPHDKQRKNNLPLVPIKKIRKRGNGSISTHGYKVHCKREKGKKIYQYEHRMVMEKFLKRSLFYHENVHHINGDRLDNRLENLELWSSFQPQGQRVIDKIKWAQEILKQYKNLL